VGSLGFFRRKQLTFEPVSEINWQVVEPSNYDPFLFTPVTAGMWKQHELWDGTYTLQDLLDIHELLMVKQENERRAREQAKIEAELNKGR